MLLDIRRAAPGKRMSKRGARVRGGLLSRRSEQGRDHAVLETDSFVTYGLPAPGTSLDTLASFMASFQVSRA